MDPGGNIASMTSTDKEGVLDKYFYTYDNSGYISEINRNRRELDAVSGKYEYSYDAIGRLTKSTHDGAIKVEYQYDAFGNRTSLTEGDTSTTYSYDVLDRLLEVNELNNNQSVVKTYDYDKRGNQTNEYVDGVLNKTFTFDATGMMSKVTDAVKGQQENLYNGLGFRVETTRPEEHIEYLCDLSKDYFNLLERTVNGEKESFVYDKNVISMSKKGSNFYYLQDELGSPMYLTGTDGVAVSSYAFDDFGRNIDPRTGKQKHGYTKDGNIIQPFAFTGYQEDEFSGLKFAQARFYDARVGRFESEDPIKGIVEIPDTVNRYLYCVNNPHNFVDLDGNSPTDANCEENINEIMCEADDPITAIINSYEGITKSLSKYCDAMVSDIETTITGLAKLGRRANPNMNNNTYATVLAKESASLSGTSRFMGNLASKLHDAGTFMTGVAIANDVVAGVKQNMAQGYGLEHLDKYVSDALVDATMTYGEISLSTAAGTAIGGTVGVSIGTGLAALTGCAGLAAAAPVAIGIGVGIGLCYGATWLADNVEIGGKTVRQHAKDFVYDTVKKVESVASDVIGWAKGLFD